MFEPTTPSYKTQELINTLSNLVKIIKKKQFYIVWDVLYNIINNSIGITIINTFWKIGSWKVRLFTVQHSQIYEMDMCW